MNLEHARDKILAIVLGVGLAALIVGLSITARGLWRHASMARAEGVVVRYEKGMSGHAPHVRFSVDGLEYTVGGRVHVEQGRGFRSGDRVGVLYPPDDPASGQLDLFLDRWFASLVVTGVGLAMTLVSGALRCRLRRESN